LLLIGERKGGEHQALLVALGRGLRRSEERREEEEEEEEEVVGSGSVSRKRGGRSEIRKKSERASEGEREGEKSRR